MRGWLGTDTALPMSWHNAATTTSSSAPARSASVAVCKQCVSWSVAKPSTMSDSDSSMPSTRSATRLWFLKLSVPMTPHCSAVDSSMRVNVVAMGQSSQNSGECGQHVAGGDGSIVEARAFGHGTAQREGRDRVNGRQQFTQFARGREVLLLGGDPHLLDTLARGEAGDDVVHQFLRGRCAGGDTDDALQIVGQLV